MFNLQLDCDRPVKISSQVSEHILRVRIVPKSERTLRTFQSSLSTIAVKVFMSFYFDILMLEVLSSKLFRLFIA